MTDKEKIEELLIEWEEGGKPSPETLCHDCPHLMEELRSQIKIITEIDNLLLEVDDAPFDTDLTACIDEDDEVFEEIVDSEPLLPPDEVFDVVVDPEAHEANSSYQRFLQSRGKGLPGIPQAELLRLMTLAAAEIDRLNKQGRKGHFIRPDTLLLRGARVEISTEPSSMDHFNVQFASPETLEGNRSNWSDQYSLACVYCMLKTGRRPFDGLTYEVMHGHLNRMPDLSMLPRAEWSIVSKALAKEPRRRWESCVAFVDALSHVSDGSIHL